MDIQRYHDAGCPNVDNHKWNMVPMVFSYHANHHRVIHLQNNTEPVLGYNEPNHKSQANMTAQEAAHFWPEVEKHANGRPLVSPAAAPCHDPTKCIGDTTEWFDEFFRLCHGCRVDYIATHSYACNADTTMQFLHMLNQRYGKKVWLTEFACTHTTSYSKQLEFMKDILPRLEAADYVYRYAWFVSRRIGDDGNVKHSASLLHTTTPTFTTLGHYYNSYQGNSAHSPAIVG